MATRSIDVHNNGTSGHGTSGRSFMTSVSAMFNNGFQYKQLKNLKRQLEKFGSPMATLVSEKIKHSFGLRSLPSAEEAIVLIHFSETGDSHFSLIYSNSILSPFNYICNHYFGSKFMRLQSEIYAVLYAKEFSASVHPTDDDDEDETTSGGEDDDDEDMMHPDDQLDQDIMNSHRNNNNGHHSSNTRSTHSNQINRNSTNNRNVNHHQMQHSNQNKSNSHQEEQRKNSNDSNIPVLNTNDDMTVSFEEQENQQQQQQHQEMMSVSRKVAAVAPSTSNNINSNSSSSVSVTKDHLSSTSSSSFASITALQVTIPPVPKLIHMSPVMNVTNAPKLLQNQDVSVQNCNPDEATIDGSLPPLELINPKSAANVEKTNDGHPIVSRRISADKSIVIQSLNSNNPSSGSNRLLPLGEESQLYKHLTVKNPIATMTSTQKAVSTASTLTSSASTPSSVSNDLSSGNTTSDKTKSSSPVRPTSSSSTSTTLNHKRNDTERIALSPAHGSSKSQVTLSRGNNSQQQLFNPVTSRSLEPLVFSKNLYGHFSVRNSNNTRQHHLRHNNNHNHHHSSTASKSYERHDPDFRPGQSASAFTTSSSNRGYHRRRRQLHVVSTASGQQQLTKRGPGRPRKDGLPNLRHGVQVASGHHTTSSSSNVSNVRVAAGAVKRQYQNHHRMFGSSSGGGSSSGVLRKKYACSSCTKSFDVRSHLESHLVTHTGEKRYICKECGSRFTQSSSLRNHRIAIHTKKFPHVCHYCRKGFLLPSMLSKHVLMYHSHEMSPPTFNLDDEDEDLLADDGDDDEVNHLVTDVDPNNILGMDDDEDEDLMIDEQNHAAASSSSSADVMNQNGISS